MKQTIWGKKDRVELYNVLPLRTPFTLMVGITNRCNLKCNYCIHSLPNNELKKLNYITDDMSYDLFVKIINDINEFPDKIKTLQIIKDGEPTLNKYLPNMIKYAKKSEKFEKIELFTNGTLLNPELNLKLINSGLDIIRISLQGLSKEKYHEITKNDINFEKLITNIKHLYKNKKKCKIHLKMINIGINTPDDMEIFDNICDEYSIQHVVPYYNNYVNYESITNTNIDIYGYNKKDIYVCPRPFITLAVSTNGNVIPCCQEPMPDLILGNVNNESLFNIWNGYNMKNIRMAHLLKRRDCYITCKKCTLPNELTYKEDNLDNHIDILLELF